MDDISHAQTITYDDTWLLGGARTPFADYNGTLRDVSATDLGIKAAREALKATRSSPDEDRRGGGGLGGADQLRCLLPAAPHRPLCRRADRRAGAAGAAAVHLGLRGHPAGGRPDRARQVAGRAVRRHRVHVAQPDRRLHATAAASSMGQVEFKDFLWEATLDTAPEVAHGRHRRGAGQALPDHARGHRRVRRQPASRAPSPPARPATSRARSSP